MQHGPPPCLIARPPGFPLPIEDSRWPAPAFLREEARDGGWLLSEISLKSRLRRPSFVMTLTALLRLSFGPLGTYLCFRPSLRRVGPFRIMICLRGSHHCLGLHNDTEQAPGFRRRNGAPRAPESRLLVEVTALTNTSNQETSSGGLV